jgi:hypothetical protein
MTLHGCCYEFLRDQGGFIAGLLTLVAGVLAYFAGCVQATATRESAKAQVVAIRDQMNQAHEDAGAQIQALGRQLEERNREIADLQWALNFQPRSLTAPFASRPHVVTSWVDPFASRHPIKNPTGFRHRVLWPKGPHILAVEEPDQPAGVAVRRYVE